MHYAGILVVAHRGQLEPATARLGALPGVEVYSSDPATGRLIVVQETDTAKAQEEGLRRIQALPGVATAALVEHRIDDGQAVPAPGDR